MRPPGSARFRYKGNRLKQLLAFCQTARTGSVSAAAERMHLSQPSVSLLIKALERGLGTQLFERRGPRLRLTAEGRVLQDLAEPLVEGLEALPDVFVERCRHIAAGQLDIAASESTIHYILPPVVKRFASRFPRIRFKLHNVTGRDGLALLRSGEVDFVVGSLPEVPEDLEYQPLADYEPVLIAPRGHPLAARSEVRLEDIGAHALMLPPRHLSTWRMVETVFRQRGVDYIVAVEAGSWEVIKEYVQAGLGVSIVASICLRGGEDLVVRPLPGYFPRRSYGVVLRRDRNPSPPAQKFIGLLREQCSTRAGEHAAAATA